MIGLDVLLYVGNGIGSSCCFVDSWPELAGGCSGEPVVFFPMNPNSSPITQLFGATILALHQSSPRFKNNNCVCLSFSGSSSPKIEWIDLC